MCACGGGGGVGVDVGGAANAVAPRTHQRISRCGTQRRRAPVAAAENWQKKKNKPKYNQSSILKCLLDLSNKTFRKTLRGTGPGGIQFESWDRWSLSLCGFCWLVQSTSLRLCAVAGRLAAGAPPSPPPAAAATPLAATLQQATHRHFKLGAMHLKFKDFDCDDCSHGQGLKGSNHP